MKVGELLQFVTHKTAVGNTAADVAAITFDSRQAGPGALFVAIRGWARDGHAFIPDAIRAGAAAIVAEEAPPGPSRVAWIVVDNSRRALAQAAAAFFDFPARKLSIIGITGTDGKTTTTALTASMLNAAGCRTGMLSTIGARFAGQDVDTGLHTTTPDPLSVQRLLRQMVDAGMQYAVLETTSHALDQERTLGCEFDIAAVTNVTPEHLDYHGTYGGYLATKARLFAGLHAYQRKKGVPKASITNADDVSFEYLHEFPAELRLTYGIDGVADVVARSIDIQPHRTRFRMQTSRGSMLITTPLLGRYNVYNVLAASAISIALDVPDSAIILGANGIGQLTGRWDRITTSDEFAVVVDFAHTPHSLEQALTLARAQTRGRLIVVFGCAGLRDRLKRPVMGQIAGRLADLIVLTAEDPRTEPVEDIMQQIGGGCEVARRALGKDYYMIPDRQAAIDFAVQLAGPGDLILLAGKGHERSICIGEVEHAWSEHGAVANAVARRKAKRIPTVDAELTP